MVEGVTTLRLTCNYECISFIQRALNPLELPKHKSSVLHIVLTTVDRVVDDFHSKFVEGPPYFLRKPCKIQTKDAWDTEYSVYVL